MGRDGVYLAVVKYPIDAEPKVKRRALLEGLEMIAAELVDEHNFTPEEIEEALDNARAFAEQEAEMKATRRAS